MMLITTLVAALQNTPWWLLIILATWGIIGLAFAVVLIMPEE